MSPSLRLLPFCMLGLAVLVAPASAAQKKTAAAQSLNFEAVNNAEWRGGNLSPSLLVKLQVLLDPAHASPGEIDANRGENTRKAVAAFRE
jgi:hypothetical protein